MIFSVLFCRCFIGINLFSCLLNIICVFLFFLILFSLVYILFKEIVRVKINNIKVIFKIMLDLENILFWLYYFLLFYFCLIVYKGLLGNVCCFENYV